MQIEQRTSKTNQKSMKILKTRCYENFKKRLPGTDMQRFLWYRIVRETVIILISVDTNMFGFYFRLKQQLQKRGKKGGADGPRARRAGGCGWPLVCFLTENI